MAYQVERLKVNYKTLEEFKQFKEYGQQELSMLEDLQDNIIEDNADSPFYGIYFADKLVARMSLYERDAKYDLYFDPRKHFWNFGSWKCSRTINIRITAGRLLILPKASGCRLKQTPA